MKTILARDVMSKQVITISPDESINTLVKCFAQHKISGIPVVDESHRMKGIISKTDLIIYEMEKEFNHIFELDLKVIINEADSQQSSTVEKIQESETKIPVKISDIMTHYVFTAPPETDIVEIACLMRKNKIHRIVITEEDKVIGIITSMDLLEIITSKSFLLDEG